MAERRMQIRLGAFIAVALLALTAMIVIFGGAPNLLTARTKYTVLFPEAPSVTTGTPVRKSGVRIGQVSALDIDDETGQVRVIVEIEGKHLPRQNEDAVISRGLLNGDTTLDFIPKGSPISSSAPYPNGAVIDGIPPLNTQKLINQAQSAVPNAQEAIQQFTATLSKFEKVGPKAEKALDEISAFVRSGREILPELRQTNLKVQEFLGANDPDGKVEGQANLKTLTKDVQDFMKNLKPLVENLNTLVKDNQGELNKTLQGLRTFVERAGELLNDDNRKAIARSLKAFDEASADLLSPANRKLVSDILKNVNESSDDLKSTLRSARVIADKLEVTVKNIDEAVKYGGTAMKDASTLIKEVGPRITQAKTIFDNIEKATKPLAENIEPTMKNISKAAEELGRTVTEARKVIEMLQQPEGSFGKLASDPALYNQLAEAASNLNRTLIRAEKIAKDLEVFADKVARKPETIGIGGVLRPNTGLKESPFAPVPSSTPFPPPNPSRGNSGGLQPFSPTPGGAILGPSEPIAVEKMTPIPPVRSNSPIK